jgi:hypothetical protein
MDEHRDFLHRVLILLPIVLVLAAAGCGGHAGNSPESAKAKAEAEIARLHPGGTTLVFDHLSKGNDNLTRDTWMVFFNTTIGGLYGSSYSGCIVSVRGKSVKATPECSYPQFSK